MTRWPRSWGSLALAAVLLALLAALAALQLSWIGELDRSERERLGNFVATGTRRVAVDFGRALGAIEEAHRGSGQPRGQLEADLVRRHRAWRAASPHPDVISRILQVDPRAVRQPRVVDAVAGRARPAAWPPELQAWERAVETLFAGTDAGAHAVSFPADPPGLVIPVPDPDAGGLPHLLLVLFDVERFERDLLAPLVEEHLGQPFGPPVDVLIARAGGGAPAYRSRPSLTAADMVNVDACERVGGTIEVSTNTSAGASAMVTRLDNGTVETTREETRLGIAPGPATAAPLDFAIDSPAWEIRARHSAGSVAAAAQAARHRNLALGLGTLAVLTVAVVLLLIGARRARTLARRQVEFVAGITHELRTPLAVIRSAAENLRDGIVDGGAQARQYGQMIHDEGRRLGDLVEQALAFAGARRSPDPVPTERIDLAPFLRGIIERCRAAANGRPAVELEIAPEIPTVFADPRALELAIANLLGNADKYGGENCPVGIRVSAPDRARVDVTVWDRGPGIPEAEQPRLFEPFFRGRQALGSQLPGSGLGLAVAQRIAEGLGGSITVESTPGAGSAFTLHLPAAARA